MGAVGQCAEGYGGGSGGAGGCVSIGSVLRYIYDNFVLNVIEIS